MMYRATKNKFQQQGVTLLLSLMVLSAMLAISFSIATVMFIEVRTSGDLLRTEDSFYAADAISEEALFQVKRNVPNNIMSLDSSISNVQITTNLPLLNDNIIRIGVLPQPGATVTSAFLNTLSHFPIYDPNCSAPNPNPDTSSSDVFCRTNTTGGSGYSKIRLTYLKTNSSSALNQPLQVYICQYKPGAVIDPTGVTSSSYNSSPCTDSLDTRGSGGGNQTYWLTPVNAGSGFTFDPNVTGNCSGVTKGCQEWNLDTTQQQELILVNTSSNNIYVQAEAYDSNGNRQGLPFYGQKVVDITGSNANINRKLRVQVPTGQTSSTQINSAAFVKTDTTTQGSWHGVYGADGFNVIGGTAAYPAYVAVTPNGNLFNSWADPTADTRGLYKDGSTSTRIADAWYNSSPWTVDLNFSDSLTHQVAIYATDWDLSSRIMTVDVLDGNTSAVLDTRSVSSFVSGKYYVWNLSGHVILRFTTNAGPNSVMNGIFFK